MAVDDEAGQLKCELNVHDGGGLIIMPTSIPVNKFHLFRL